LDTSKIEEFEEYVSKEITPATVDIDRLEDRNRKHIQKLVYTNLVDRFDSMVDGSLLVNCSNSYLVEEATKGMSQPITEAELVKILVQSDNLQDALEERLKASLRNSVLRERHSRKLAALFRTFDAFATDGDFFSVPKVNISTGDVVEKFKPQDKTVPHSLCGYADWLYSRRNSIVHGAGTNRFLENDRKQIKKLYKSDLKQTFRIKLSAITVASKYYLSVAKILKEAAEIA